MNELRFTVLAKWDEAAKIWYVAESNVPGLCAEAKTTAALEKLLRVMIPELVELNGMPDNADDNLDEHSVPWELVYKTEGRLALDC
ncbi:MAG: DUF1902 domain-containing protein [Candidatus Berkelbacteria bacterium]|nr:DUF1902 domain-containing protein [Candidatus Berkelbacteria bacterium]